MDNFEMALGAAIWALIIAGVTVAVQQGWVSEEAVVIGIFAYICVAAIYLCVAEEIKS